MRSQQFFGNVSFLYAIEFFGHTFGGWNKAKGLVQRIAKEFYFFIAGPTVNVKFIHDKNKLAQTPEPCKVYF